MKIINTSKAVEPAGHYSQAIVHNGLVYAAGMLGKDPENPDAEPGDIRQQTRLALANLSAVLEEAGSDLNHVVRMTVYVSGIEHWGPVNEEYAEVMGSHKPARAIVPVQNFMGPYVVEIVATAAVRD